MFRSRHWRYFILMGFLVLFIAAAISAEDRDIITGRDLLMLMREKKGNLAKPSYAERSKKPVEPVVTEPPISEPTITELAISGPNEQAEQKPAEPVVSDVIGKKEQVPEVPKSAVSERQPSVPEGDDLLGLIPSEALVVARLNNLDYTLGQIDQFLSGVSPLPMGVSMLVRMQLGNVLGSPELNGVNTGGDFAVFGMLLPGKPAEPDSEELFVGALVPVSDYTRFVTGNPNISQPDAKGVSKITSANIPQMAVKKIGDYAFVGLSENYDKLIVISEKLSTSKETRITDLLDDKEIESATKKPVWYTAM